MFRRLLLPASLIFSFAAHSPANAEDALKLSGSVRGRYEALTGEFRPGLPDDDDLISLRTILTAEYDFGAVRIGGELRDARVYDAGPNSPAGTGEVNALEPIQVYVGFDIEDALGRGSTATIDIGRFILDLGSRRLAADDNFRNTTNGFTGIRANWQGKRKEKVTLFFTAPQVRLPNEKESILDNEVKLDEEGFDLLFWGGIVTLPDAIGGVSIDAYFYGLGEDDSAGQATRNRQLFTPGFRLFRSPKEGAWDFELEAVYQFGNIRTSTTMDAAKQDVAATFVRAAIGRTFRGPWAPRLAFELDYASGDRRGGNYNRFDTLYGSRSGDFGATGIYGAYARANILAPALRLQLVPSERWDGFLHYRPAWLGSRTDSFANTGVRDPAGASGRFAGHQIEARTRYWIVPKRLQLESGGALLLRGRFLKDAPNGAGNGDTVYGYSAVTFTF